MDTRANPGVTCSSPSSINRNLGIYLLRKLKNKLVVLLRFSAEQAENMLEKNLLYSNIKITFMKLKSDANQQFFTDVHF